MMAITMSTEYEVLRGFDAINKFTNYPKRLSTFLKIRRSNSCGNPDLRYLDQISKYFSTDKTVRFSAEEIVKYAKYKKLWNLSIAMHKLPDR